MLRIGGAMPTLLRAALVVLLYRQSFAVLFANLVVPLPVAYVLRDAVSHQWLLIWIALMYALTLLRIVHSYCFFRCQKKEQKPLRWARLFTVWSALSSLLWGWVGWVGFIPEQPQLIAFSCIVLTGLSCGAVPSLSAYPPAYTSLILAMLTPFAVRCLMQADPISTVYLAFLVCLVAVNLYYSRVTYRTIRETVQLKHTNDELIMALEQERDHATAASRAKSRFLAAASHDLRQPAHALGLFAATLENRARQGDLPAADAYYLADRFRALIRTMGDLLHGLLDVSRLDAGLVQVKRCRISVSELFDTLREEYARQAEERGLRFDVVNCSQWVDSDPLLLRRILDNLLSNTLRHGTGKRLLLGCRRRNGCLDIQVVDTGPGIACEDQNVIFQEFSRLVSAEGCQSREQGMGLGLSIVWRLASLLNHSLTLNSVLGSGSVFTVTVPVTEPMPLSAPAVTAQPVRTAADVMVLDDDSQVVAALSSLLVSWGYRCYSGSDMESLCRHHEDSGGAPVQLIIADYRLGPGLTGVEAVEQLAGRLGYTIPALIITGDTSEQTLKRLAAGRYPFLHKPLSPERLREAIEQVLGRE